MAGARKEIPKEWTYNYYGDAARQEVIRALGDHGAYKGVT